MHRIATRCVIHLLVVVAVMGATRGRAETPKPVYCEPMGAPGGPLTLVVLHGSSGPDAYRALAKTYADKGYSVLFPHLFDAAKGTGRTDADFAVWVDAVRSCIQRQAAPGKPVVLFGLSLGASVALAAGTQLQNIAAVIDWSGSLPDIYFAQMQQLPPLLILHGDKDTNVPVVNARQLFTLCRRTGTPCSGTIYPGEGHMFPGQTADATRRTLSFLQQVRDTAAARTVNPNAATPMPPQ